MTPAFIVDEAKLLENLERVKRIKEKSGCQLLYSVKPLSEPTTLGIIKEHVDGLTVSSLFEAKLAHEVIGDRSKIHIVTPGLREKEIGEISEYASLITYNSIGQAKRLHRLINKEYTAGIRVNPQLSFVDEPRYDPCKANSKLGVPIDDLKERVEELDFIDGLHFHNHCEGKDTKPILETVQKLISELGFWLKNLNWINIGGGYFFEHVKDYEDLYKAIAMLRGLGLNVMMEPGGTIVRSAGFLRSSVIDIFENKGVKIAVIDASVNHIPEALEYSFKYKMSETSDGETPHKYMLAGPTCLAGDEFGEYCFKKPLEIGDTITFHNVGCYTVVRANMFNGVNLPSNYLRNKDGKEVLLKEFDYNYYRSRWI